MESERVLLLAALTGRNGRLQAIAWLNRHVSGDRWTGRLVDCSDLFVMRAVDARSEGRCCARNSTPNTDMKVDACVGGPNFTLLRFPPT